MAPGRSKMVRACVLGVRLGMSFRSRGGGRLYVRRLEQNSARLAMMVDMVERWQGCCSAITCCAMMIAALES